MGAVQSTSVFLGSEDAMQLTQLYSKLRHAVKENDLQESKASTAECAPCLQLRASN